jgi:hypothetical protein
MSDPSHAEQVAEAIMTSLCDFSENEDFEGPHPDRAAMRIYTDFVRPLEVEIERQSEQKERQMAHIRELQVENGRLRLDRDDHVAEEHRLRDVIWNWGLEADPGSEIRKAASAALFSPQVVLAEELRGYINSLMEEGMQDGR